MNKLKELAQKALSKTTSYTNRLAKRAGKLDKNALLTLLGLASFVVAGFILAAWLGFTVLGVALVLVGERG